MPPTTGGLCGGPFFAQWLGVSIRNINDTTPTPLQVRAACPTIDLPFPLSRHSGGYRRGSFGGLLLFPLPAL